MRNLLKAILVALFVVCSVSGAKDGPFPIYAAVGQWQVKDRDLSLQIQILKILPAAQGQVQKAVVKVVARNLTDGKVMATGYSTHKMVESDFEVVLRDWKNGRARLVVKPEYKVVNNQQILELKMEMIELDTPGVQGVPSSTLIRLTK